MGADRNRIDELARAVAQRTKVAWDDEMRSAENGSDQAIIAQLETVERIIEAHWGLPGNVKSLGDFELIEEIGRGAMGVVYKARQRSLDRFVAIKVLSWDVVSSEVSIARFEREAKALAALDHPNIVGVHSVDRVDDLHFISMELVEGAALASVIPEQGMKLEDMLGIGAALADALSFAHEHDVVHRDLKPANVMIDQAKRPKVLDFGLARLRRENRLSSDARNVTVTFDRTDKSSLLGTVPYMSPEQAEGQELDHRTDIFSLGVVLYEMATGRRPFDGPSPASVISSIVNDRHPPVRTIRPALPGDLERIIFHCLRKNPEQRYQTAKGLRNELEELARRVELEEFRTKPEPPRRKAPWIAIAVALAAIWAVALYLIFVPPPSKHPPYVAILPFEVQGQQDENLEAMSAGLAEVLTTKLNRLTHQKLQIAPTSSTGKFAGLSARDVGAWLGADLVISGTLLRSGDDIHISVEATEPSDDRQSRVRALTTHLGDPLDLQDQVMFTVVSMLKLELDDNDKAALQSHGTRKAASSRLYLRGLGFLSDHSRIANIDKAIQSLEEAIEEDPGDAEAQAKLGVACWKRYQRDGEARWLSRALAACTTSVAVGADLAAGHLCLGRIQLATGQAGEAQAHYGWAMSLDPTSDEAYQGLVRVYNRMGNPAAAEIIYKKAVSVRPNYWAGHAWLGGYYSSAGRYVEAEESLRKVIELIPASHRAHADLGRILLAQREFEKAVKNFRRSLELAVNVHAYAGLGKAYLEMDRYAEAVPALEKAVRLEPGDRALWFELANAYQATGNRTEALAAYRRALQLPYSPVIDRRESWSLAPDEFVTRAPIKLCSRPR